MITAFILTSRPAEARGFIHKKAFGLLQRTFAPAIDVALGFVPGGSIVREGLKRIRGGPPPGTIGRFGLGQTQPLPQFPPTSFGPAAPFPPVIPPPLQLPSTPTITTPAERSLGVDFQAVTGAFGMPAMAPFAETRVVLDCPPGMVLGKDDLCYPSAVLRRNSQFRKWRSAPRPTVTRRDERALARIDSVQKALKRLGKKAGLKVTG